MPMPNFVRHVNKHVFNRYELKKGERPVLVHIGRTSGETYKTPVEAKEVDGGYGFVLMYGADATDWVKNIRASGTATLLVDGDRRALVNPQVLVGDEAWDLFPDESSRPPARLNVTEVMRMDLASTARC